MKYAINLIDLAALNETAEYKILVQCLLMPLFDKEPQTVNCNKSRVDEEAILVSDDIGDDRMAAVVQLVRQGTGVRKGIHKNKLRLYQSKTGKGGWKRI